MDFFYVPITAKLIVFSIKTGSKIGSKVDSVANLIVLISINRVIIYKG